MKSLFYNLITFIKLALSIFQSTINILSKYPLQQNSYTPSIFHYCFIFNPFVFVFEYFLTSREALSKNRPFTSLFFPLRPHSGFAYSDQYRLLPPAMAEASDDTRDIEKLYEYGERLNEAKDKSQVTNHFFFLGFTSVIVVNLKIRLFFLQNVDDYKNIIASATSTSLKARQLAAQLIPRFFKFFPGLSGTAVDAHLDLCEAEELGVSILIIGSLL